jgi:hypothetical protein
MNRLAWKCKHCNVVQWKTNNATSKEQHMETHGITKENGNLVPTKHMTPFEAARRRAEGTAPLRQSESYSSLGVIVMKQPFEDALIAFLIIAQMALSLVENAYFVEFLQVIYPTIGQILPCGSTIRSLIKIYFERRKRQLKGSLGRAKSKVHFSFDLWTSPNHLALLGIIAHYIDEYGQNQSVCNIPFFGFQRVGQTPHQH